MATSWAEEAPVGLAAGATTLGLLLAVFSATEIERNLHAAATAPDPLAVVSEVEPPSAVPAVPQPEPKQVPEPESEPEPELVLVDDEMTMECAPAFTVTFSERLDLVDDFGAEAKALRAWMDEHPSAQVLVRGHADERGDEGFNLRLSHQRAKKVGDALERRGIDGRKVTVQAFGEYRPQVGLEESDVRQRRVTVEVVDIPPCKEEL